MGRMWILATILQVLVANPVAAQVRWLRGPEIATLFSGGQFDGVYPGESGWSEAYRADGSLDYTDRDGPRTGQWSVRGDQFCTFYTTGGGACWQVERVSENCLRFYVVAAVGAEPDSRPGATGWARSRPATCGPGRPVS